MAFGLTDLQRQVDAAVAEIPPEHKGALIGVVDIRGKVTVVVAGKINDHWTVFGKVAKVPGAPVEAEGGVKLSW